MKIKKPPFDVRLEDLLSKRPCPEGLDVYYLLGGDAEKATVHAHTLATLQREHPVFLRWLIQTGLMSAPPAHSSRMSDEAPQLPPDDFGRVVAIDATRVPDTYAVIDPASGEAYFYVGFLPGTAIEDVYRSVNGMAPTVPPTTPDPDPAQPPDPSPDPAQ